MLFFTRHLILLLFLPRSLVRGSVIDNDISYMKVTDLRQ